MNARLLLVEDEPKTARILKALIAETRPKWTVSWAASCGEARAEWAGHRPSAVLLDFNLPDGNGCLLLREMRRDDPRLPAVIMSGNDLGHVRESGGKGLPFVFMSKPFSVDDLIGHIERQIHASCLLGQSGFVTVKGTYSVVSQLFAEDGVEPLSLARRPGDRAIARSDAGAGRAKPSRGSKIAGFQREAKNAAL